jgi:SHS2 domain-containing protein
MKKPYSPRKRTYEHSNGLRRLAEYNKVMGFEEISHTADWSARVWAKDLPSLFGEAARAMHSLSGTTAGNGTRVEQAFEAEGPDAESLLVAFLSELLYYEEQEDLVFENFEFQVEGQRLKVEMEGARMASSEKAIKAVTYHNLKIEKTNRGFETTIVFDV